MRNMIVAVSFAVLGVPLVSVSLLAHHGAAGLDTGKEITLKGTVTGWIWSNPHCFLQFDAKDDTGMVRNWAVETQNPTAMRRARSRRARGADAGNARTPRAADPGRQAADQAAAPPRRRETPASPREHPAARSR